MNRRFDFRSPVMMAVYIVAGVLFILYFGFSIFFNSHYLPNTTVSATACGWKTASDLEKIHEQTASDYVLTITDRAGEKFTVNGSDISYAYVKQGEEADILKSQNPFSWPAALFEAYEYSLSTSVQYDKTAAAEVIGKLGLFQQEYIQPPTDAYIQMNETGYEVIPEVMGTTPVADKVQAAILSALDIADSEITLSDECYVNPALYTTSETIITATEKIDSYLAATITYEMEGSDEDLSAEEIFQMLQLHEDFSITIDTAKIDRFVQQLATKYNTYGDKRQFTTSKGDVIAVGGGDYGWVISKKKEASQILADLEGGTAVSREPVYEQRAIKSGPDDIGDTYVEVDYSSQHLWVYKDGQMILESDFVSGNMRRGYGSPDGIFKIVYKERNAVLRGEDYTSPVSYFMPFAYNVGFHDADWRNKFGGEIYKTNGSHGCINLPPDFARQLYESVDIGTPVVAYYREPIILTSENARISNAFSYKAP